jgi:hypothetical protein
MARSEDNRGRLPLRISLLPSAARISDITSFEGLGAWRGDHDALELAATSTDALAHGGQGSDGPTVADQFGRLHRPPGCPVRTAARHLSVG